jgi:hypothetical protein
VGAKEKASHARRRLPPSVSPPCRTGVVRVDEHDLVVLVRRVLVDPVGVEDAQAAEAAPRALLGEDLQVARRFELRHPLVHRLAVHDTLGHRLLAAAAADADAVHDVALLGLVAAGETGGVDGRLFVRFPGPETRLGRPARPPRRRGTPPTPPSSLFLSPEAPSLVRAGRPREAHDARLLAVLPAPHAQQEAHDVRLLALPQLLDVLKRRGDREKKGGGWASERRARAPDRGRPRCAGVVRDARGGSGRATAPRRGRARRGGRRRGGAARGDRRRRPSRARPLSRDRGTRPPPASGRRRPPRASPRAAAAACGAAAPRLAQRGAFRPARPPAVARGDPARRGAGRRPRRGAQPPRAAPPRPQSIARPPAAAAPSPSRGWRTHLVGAHGGEAPGGQV